MAALVDVFILIYRLRHATLPVCPNKNLALGTKRRRKSDMIFRPMRSAHRLCTRSKLAILLFAISWLSSTTYAQSQTGSLSGVVVDASGASIQNATVEARKSDTGLTL